MVFNNNFKVNNENDLKLAFDGPTKTQRNGQTAALFSDLLVVQSTITGFKSIRHEDNGSWFIQTLCDNINQQNCNEYVFETSNDMLKIMYKNEMNSLFLVYIFWIL